MGFYQVKSSALVKRYVHEIGSGFIQSLLDPVSGNTISLSHISFVEVASALGRKYRGGVITLMERNIAYSVLKRHFLLEYHLVEVNQSVLSLAADLTQQHPLRAYDAIQLASALIVNADLLSHALPPLVFVCADAKLCLAAIAEGLVTDNPNLHP